MEVKLQLNSVGSVMKELHHMSCLLKLLIKRLYIEFNTISVQVLSEIDYVMKRNQKLFPLPVRDPF